MLFGMGVRDRARAETSERILAAARQQIAEHGGVGLSMRAVAREAGLVSSAVYRYVETREALLTAMIIESYGHLAEALQAVNALGEERRWRALAVAFREWALANPHEFQLIYGTPIPGYVAPPETVPAAAAVAAPFVSCLGEHRVDGFTSGELESQLAASAGGFGVSPSGLGAVIAELAALVGVVSLELAGHLVGTADPADHLFAAIVDRQVETLGLGGWERRVRRGRRR